jgi:hypothetical protein
LIAHPREFGFTKLHKQWIFNGSICIHQSVKFSHLNEANEKILEDFIHEIGRQMNTISMLKLMAHKAKYILFIDMRSLRCILKRHLPNNPPPPPSFVSPLHQKEKWIINHGIILNKIILTIGRTSSFYSCRNVNELNVLSSHLRSNINKERL